MYGMIKFVTQRMREAKTMLKAQDVFVVFFFSIHPLSEVILSRN